MTNNALWAVCSFQGVAGTCHLIYSFPEVSGKPRGSQRWDRAAGQTVRHIYSLFYSDCSQTAQTNWSAW